MAEAPPGDQQLNLDDQSIPIGKKAECEAIWELLESTTSLSVVGEFLKSRKQHFSAASWGEMFEKRVLPLIVRGELEPNDLARLLTEAEQFGRCHVFLYKTHKEKSKHFLDEVRIKKICDSANLSSLLSGSVNWETPADPTLSSITRNVDGENFSTTFGILETRIERQFLNDELVDNIYTKRWTQTSVRAVNSLRLHQSGLLEIRIQSHQSSTKYESDISRIWKVVSAFLPQTDFSPFSLAKAKSNLWKESEELKNKIRFRDSLLMNNSGTSILASTGGDTGDLFKDANASDSIDAFLKGNGAYCDSMNIWFLPVENVFDRQVHVLLSGLYNEFAMTANCTKAEYEYVLNELRLHST